jgi:pimeloyl-ACP methyl ester carboxylesterase
MRHLTVLALVGLLWLGLLPLVAAQDSALPSFEVAPCPMPLSEGLEGSVVTCGYLTVPEDYADPANGRTLRLAVARIAAVSPNPAPDPLIIMQGGPGGSTLADFSVFAEFREFIPFMAEREMILFDQRGTLYSEPFLSCTEEDEFLRSAAQTGISTEDYNAQYPGILAACRARLSAEGVNTNAFDSVANAADVESLRVALGYEQVNLYGVSYGTLLALHVMRDHPQGIRSVILDAVVPTQTNFFIEAGQSAQRAFDTLFAACAADAACNEAYPTLEADFYGLYESLEAAPATVDYNDPETGESYAVVVDGERFLGLNFLLMYNTPYIPLLPLNITLAAETGDFSYLLDAIAFAYFDSMSSDGMYWSVVCAEEGDFTLEEVTASTEGLRPEVARVFDPSYGLDVCAAWAVEVLPALVDEPVVSDIPTLLMSGQFDPITPPAYAEIAASTLSQSYNLVFPGVGHGAIGAGDCPFNIMADFLNEPSQAPDSSCINEMRMVFQ